VPIPQVQLGITSQPHPTVRRLVPSRVGLTFDFPSSGLLVKPLGIPLLDHAQRRIYVDLDERDGRAVLCMQFTREGAVRDVGGDEGCEGERAGRGEEERDFAYTTDLRVSDLSGAKERGRSVFDVVGYGARWGSRV
jgi:hypothetical protein